MGYIKTLSDIVHLLESYRGRDKVMRILTYVAMYMGSDGKTAAQIKWRTVGGELGACRMFLRLFDSLPMLLLNLSTSFGLREKRPMVRILNLMSGLLNQGFYPSEHIAWLRQKKILSGEPRPFLLLGLFIWASSLTVEIIKSLAKIRYINLEASKLRKQKELDRDNSTQNEEIKQSLHRLATEQSEVCLILLQSCCDLTNAVSWFPPGLLWAGKLTSRMNGIMGLGSSLIMLYRAWPPKRLS